MKYYVLYKYEDEALLVCSATLVRRRQTIFGQTRIKKNSQKKGKYWKENKCLVRTSTYFSFRPEKLWWESKKKKQKFKRKAYTKHIFLFLITLNKFLSNLPSRFMSIFRKYLEPWKGIAMEHISLHFRHLFVSTNQVWQRQYGSFGYRPMEALNSRMAQIKRLPHSVGWPLKLSRIICKRHLFLAQSQHPMSTIIKWQRKRQTPWRFQIIYAEYCPLFIYLKFIWPHIKINTTHFRTIPFNVLRHHRNPLSMSAHKHTWSQS